MTYNITDETYVQRLRNRSLIPSMSKPSVKRIVWSSGLLFAVAMT